MKKVGMGRECNIMGKRRNGYRLLVGKPQGKRLLARYTC
jgi:hypothetical protein